MDIKDKIIGIIVDITGLEELRQNEDIDLIEEDVLDSFAFIQLLDAIYDEFDVEIEPTQVDKDTWKNVDSISKLVEEKISKD